MGYIHDGDTVGRPQKSQSDGIKSSLSMVRHLPYYVYILIMYTSSLILTGYYVYYHNQALQIPLVNSLNNPSLYPNDPFAATLPYYASMLWRLVAWSTRIIPLEPLLLSLFLVERFLLIYAAGNLARTLIPKSRLAPIGAMAFFALAPTPILGGGTLVMPYFEQTGFSIPFFMLAMAAFYKSRHIAWAVWLAIAFNMNSMYGTYALTYFAAVFLLDPNYRKDLKAWIASFVLFIALASPAILLTKSAFNKNIVGNSLWIKACQARLPHHLFPNTWPAANYIKFGLVMFLTLILLWQYRGKTQKLFKFGAVWAGVSLLWVIYALVAAGVKSSSLLIMQPARATDIWYCFAMVALISVCAERAENAVDNKPVMITAFIASVLFWYAGSISPELILVTLIAITMQPVSKHILRNGSPKRIALLLGLLVLALSLRAFNTRAEGEVNMENAMIIHPGASEENIARWAEINTSEDSIFLVNPNWAEFRGMSFRPVFVTWKDGSALLWYRPYAKQWVERVQALGYDITTRKIRGEHINKELNRLYDNLTDSQIKTLKAHYNIRYWVTKTNRKSHYHTIYKNRLYKVLDLN